MCACLLINPDKTKLGVSRSKRFAKDFSLAINRWLSWQICLSYRSTFRLKNVEYDTYVMNARFTTSYFVSRERITYLLGFFQNKSLNA